MIKANHRTTRNGVLRALAAALILTACGDDAVGVVEFGTDELTTQLAVTPDHVHLYESEVTFTVSVTDPAGDPVTDFDIVQVERRGEGATSWTTMEAAKEGDFYVARHVFEASGEYQIRVTGLRPSDDALVVLLEDATLHAVPPHADVDGYHITLEPDPGHIHEGDAAEVRFWVADEETETPVTGLAATVVIVESDGAVSEHAAEEGADGLYRASHTFATAGATSLGIRFTGPDQQSHEWSLEIEVHEAH